MFICHEGVPEIEITCLTQTVMEGMSKNEVKSAISAVGKSILSLIMGCFSLCWSMYVQY